MPDPNAPATFPYANRNTIQLVQDAATSGVANPSAPTAVATASGSGLTQSQKVVTGTTSTVAGARTVARIVSVSVDPAAGQAVVLSYATPAVAAAGFAVVQAGGYWESPVPITVAVYAIAASGSNNVTVVEYL